MRPPLTKKRRAAIHAYVSLQGEKLDYLQGLMIDAVLKAERMNADILYSYLERRGYRWKRGYWSKKR